MIRLLFLGDIVGKPGREAVKRLVPGLRNRHRLDCIVANAENAAGGAGLTTSIAHELKGYGLDALTLGDHCWDQRGFAEEIDRLDFVCRPTNLPESCPGRRELLVDLPGGKRLGVVTILGRQFMKIHADDPFRAAEQVVDELGRAADLLLVEIHAEATSEKVAMGWLLDGRAAAVLGTHTHIPTADARILPRGTAYLTDAGMSGPYESILGREVAPGIARFLDGLPRRHPVAEGDVRLCGVLLELDPAKGVATKIERLEVPLELL